MNEAQRQGVDWVVQLEPLTTDIWEAQVVFADDRPGLVVLWPASGDIDTTGGLNRVGVLAELLIRGTRSAE